MQFSQSNCTRLLASDTTIIVTGATGWLGQAALEMLANTFGDHLPQRVRAFASSACTVALRAGPRIACRPLPEILNLPAGAYLFFHFAFLGKERTAQLSLPDYARAVAQITDLMDGAMRRVDTQGIVLPSSGAVYRAGSELDDDLERNPYGVLKRRDEEHFTRLALDLGIPLTVARIFNMAGPYINKLDSYALGAILMDLLHGRPIAIKAAYPVIRSYVHVRDILDLTLLCQFSRDGGAVSFDTAGDVEVEVGQLARLAAIALGYPDHPITRPAMQHTPVNRYVGSPGKFRALLAQFDFPLLALSGQIADTANFLRRTQFPD